MDDTRTLYSCKEQEEALSFQLPVKPSPVMIESEEADHRFEFLIDQDLISSSGDAMCSADDIIINGKLLPFKLPLQTGPVVSVCRRAEGKGKITSSLAFSNSPTDQKGKKTERSGGGFEKAVHVLRKNTALTRPRPRRMVLGVPKFPTEMELRDIRKRQKNATPCRANGGEQPSDQIHVVRRQRGWKLLHSLSCTEPDADSVVVANGSIPYPPAPIKGNDDVGGTWNLMVKV